MADSRFDKKWVVAAGAALVGLIVLGVTMFRPSEEDRVREVLTRFTKAVTVKSDDTPLSRLGRIRSEFKEIVSDDVGIDLAELDVRVRGRAKVVEAATAAGLQFQSADCELVNMTIKIDERSTTAKVDAVAAVTAIRGGERKVDKRDVHFLLFKDGTWRITTVDVAAPSPSS